MAQNSYAVLWFKGRELNMVFGLQLSISRVGSTVNFWVMGYLYDLVKQSNLDGTQILGAVLFLGIVIRIRFQFKPDLYNYLQLELHVFFRWFAD